MRRSDRGIAPPVPAQETAPLEAPAGGGACRSATRQRARGTPPGPTAGIGHSTATGKADGPTLAAHRCEIERRPHDPFQPEADQREWPPASAALETYADFVSLTPADRAIQLTAVLFGDRDPQSAAGQQAGLSAGKMSALRLTDCLRTAPANSRSQTIETYWAVRQIAAQHRSFLHQIRRMEALRLSLSAKSSLARSDVEPSHGPPGG